MTAFDFGPFLLLSEKDNVLVARANAPEGLVATLETGAVLLSRAIPMAHKIARRAAAEGDDPEIRHAHRHLHSTDCSRRTRPYS